VWPPSRERYRWGCASAVQSGRTTEPHTSVASRRSYGSVGSGDSVAHCCTVAGAVRGCHVRPPSTEAASMSGLSAAPWDGFPQAYMTFGAPGAKAREIAQVGPALA